MTVGELRALLANAPDEALVEMEVYDDDNQCCGGCDDCGLSATDIGSVSYNAETNTVTLTEAS
jgi:Fe-S oxidoreductase